MSVVGFDLGGATSKIGLARNRGIDIILNESSSRQTPSLVSFGARNRYLGEAAKTQEISNFKNTVGSLKRLIGRKFNDPELENEKKFLGCQLVDAGSEVGVKVNYAGEEQVFSATQVLGMFLGKLRDITHAELKLAVSDCVISIPGWYTDIQRRAVLDAAEIAGLNPLRLMNDTTASALGYGITKTDLPEDKPRRVVIVDLGYSDYSVSVVDYLKGRLEVKASAYDRHLGGRDFDFLLLEHFAQQFGTKYKIDIKSNPKARLRLAAACEKMKKILSANASAPISVESIMNDIDVQGSMGRDEFEALIEPLLSRLTKPIEQALKDAGITVADVDAIEVVGGSTRVPSVKTVISQFFGKPLSFTLNQDEAIARGATLQCAMISPVFKVREFSITDITYYPIKIQWQKSTDTPEEETELTVFNHGNIIPSTKILTFHRREPFEIEAAYLDASHLPGGISPQIARYSITKVPPPGDLSEDDYTIVKVKTRVNLHGIFSFEGAWYVEDVEKEEAIPPAATGAESGEKMEVDGAAAQTNGVPAAPTTRKVRKTHKKGDLPTGQGTTSLEQGVLTTLRDSEAQMHSADKLVADTEDRKNALEEYVYEARSKLESDWNGYYTADERSKLSQALEDAENWLYDEGEDATKSVYVKRMEELKRLGDPIAHRVREAFERDPASKQLREALSDYYERASGNDLKYEHIAQGDKQKIIEKVATVQKWLEDHQAKQAERPKSVDPVLRSADILKQREDLIYFATPILTKPKPKVDVPKPDANANANASKEAHSAQAPPPPNASTPPPPAPDAAAADPAVPEKAMDVD